MADIVNKATRSRMMAGIRGRDTRPEVLIRSLLHRQGFRFRLHVQELPGKPDIVLPRYRAVVFVHGCLWHAHGCHLFKWPQTRPGFWRDKITRNVANDERGTKALLTDGWRVGVVWECAIKGAGKDIKKTMRGLTTWLYSSCDSFQVSG